MPRASLSAAQATPSKAASSKKLIVKLKVDGKKLASFSQPTSPSKTASSKLANHNHSPRNSSPLAAGGITPDEAGKMSPKVAEGTPASSFAGSAAAETKVEATPVKAGAKRARGTGQPGKPGRKKTKIDGNGTGATPASHKLGPKSNQGAINAQLRALDRSGKPCKRWTKASITLKSFTGVQWSLPKWATPIVDKSLNVSEAPSTAPSVNGDEVRKDAPSAAPTEVGEPMSIVITPPEQTAPIATA